MARPRATSVVRLLAVLLWAGLAVAAADAPPSITLVASDPPSGSTLFKLNTPPPTGVLSPTYDLALTYSLVSNLSGTHYIYRGTDCGGWGGGYEFFSLVAGVPKTVTVSTLQGNPNVSYPCTIKDVGACLQHVDGGGASVACQLSPLTYTFSGQTYGEGRPFFTIGRGSGGLAGRPALAFDGTSFVAVYLLDGQARAARITPDGQVLEPDGLQLGPAVQVPAVAFDGQNHLSVWVGPASEVRGARFTPAGTVLDAPSLSILPEAQAKERPITVACGPDNCLIAWRTLSDEIRCARVSRDGASLDGPSGFSIGTGFYPWAAYGGGTYLVAWHAWDSNLLDIVGARVSPAGGVTPPGPFVIFSGDEDQDHVSLTSDGTDFFVVWHDLRGGDSGNDGSAHGARVSAAGVVLDDTPIPIVPYSVGVTAAFDGTNYLAAWNAETPPRQIDVFAHRVSPAGALLDPQPEPIATAAGPDWVPRAVCGAGRCLFTWNGADPLDETNRCQNGCSYGRILAWPPDPFAAPAAVARSSAAPSQAWTAVPSPVTSSIFDLYVADPDHAFAGTLESWDGRLLGYRDGSWSVVLDGIPTQPRLYSVWGSSANAVWTSGMNYEMVRFDGTTYAATEWLNSTDATAIWSADGTRILAVGTRGTFAYHDGSDIEANPWLDEVHWRNGFTGVAVDLWDLWGAGANDVYAVGGLGRLLHYDGTRWTRVGVPTRQDLNAVWGSGPRDVFAVGDFGTILHFDGNTWTAQVSPTSEHLKGVWGVSASYVLAVGLNGTILRYDGASWQAEFSGTSRHLFDVEGSGTKAWVVGEAGTILEKTLPDGVVAAAVSVADTRADEGAQVIELEVTLSAASDQAVSVGYSTVSGTAIAGLDFQGVSGQLAFPAGSLQQTIQVPLIHDRLHEAEEFFAVELSAPQGATLAKLRALARIVDDDLTAGFYTVTPCRVFDTRKVSGPTLGAPLSCGIEQSFAVAGKCEVPSSATAVSVNLTGTESTAPGNIRLFASGTSAPLVSTLNYAAGQTRANNAVAPLGTDGQIAVLCRPSGTTHVVLDVNGYFQ